MLERENPQYLLWKLGRMLHEQLRRPHELRDLEYVATLKSVIESLRWQIKTNRRGRNGYR